MHISIILSLDVELSWTYVEGLVDGNDRMSMANACNSPTRNKVPFIHAGNCPITGSLIGRGTSGVSLNAGLSVFSGDFNILSMGIDTRRAVAKINTLNVSIAE
jgi:hypothetical protein